MEGHRLAGHEQVGHPALRLLLPGRREGGRGREGVGGAGEHKVGLGGGEGGRALELGSRRFAPAGGAVIQLRV